MAKEKVSYQEVYDLYQQCCETKDLGEFYADYRVKYDKFMNWLHIPADTRSAFPVISVQSPVSIQCCWQS
jgi:hypothetical protein